MSDDGGGGRRLGRYHLGETLGGGPLGTVYQGTLSGVGFERRFAIKCMHPALVADPAMAAKIAGAARSYGGLQHPQIARLHEFGVTDGETFTATELVDGIDLERLTAGGGLRHGSAASALITAARAIAFAHGRGHSHLGLCPTNILITAAGGLKVTDFGTLQPRLPKRPAQDPSLDRRIPFLAPEQLAGEPTSAATDVFQLGVLGYLLFTGQLPFTAPSAFDTAQLILSGALPRIELPKPITKILQRCLARSPFERFPDAGALADTMEDAKSALALPGTLVELGPQVAAEAARISRLPVEERGLPKPAPPIDASEKPVSAAPPKRVVRGPAKRRPQDLKKTMMGIGNPLMPTAATPDGDDDSPTQVQPPLDVPTPQPIAAEGEEERLDTTPMLDAVDTVSGVAPPVHVEGITPAPTPLLETPEAAEPPPPTPPPPAPPTPTPPTPETLELAEPEPQPADTETLAPPEPALQTIETLEPDTYEPGPSEPDGEASPLPAEGGLSAAPRSRRGLAIAAVFAALVGAGGFVAYSMFAESDGAVVAQPTAAGADTTPNTPPPPLVPPDAGVVAAAPADASPEQPQPADAAAVAVAVAAIDAGAPLAAADAQPTTTAGAGTAGALSITSKPRGAKVYLDGTEIGKTPIETEATADRHRLAIILPGHALHTADISGSGEIHVDLAEVTPSGGAGGIKVRCKQKNRYYVFVDGSDTGQLCPTERIGVKQGPHKVEIYDPVTDSRSEFPADVDNTNRSLRVHVD